MNTREIIATEILNRVNIGIKNKYNRASYSLQAADDIIDKLKSPSNFITEQAANYCCDYRGTDEACNTPCEKCNRKARRVFVAAIEAIRNEASCERCGKVTHIDKLDSKPSDLDELYRPRSVIDWFNCFFRPTKWRLIQLDRAMDDNIQFDRLECENCYGPGYSKI
jgi:hypothetical protein